MTPPTATTPDIFLEAVKRLHMRPGEILVIKGIECTIEAALVLQREVTAILPEGVKVMMLPPGADVEVITPHPVLEVEL